MKLADLESMISRRENAMASMGLVPNRSSEGVRDFCVTQPCIVLLYPACVTTGVPASS